MTKDIALSAIAEVLDANDRAVQLIGQTIANSNRALRQVLSYVAEPEPSSTEKPYLSVEEVAARIGYAKSYIYQLVHNQKIPYLKSGRRLLFETRIIDRWLRSFSVQTTEQLRQGANNALV